MCDVSTSCDAYCCCDSECSSTATTYWNNYNLCSNSGYSIPFCSTFNSQPLHVHDLSQGLRLIYTVNSIKFSSYNDCFVLVKSILLMQRVAT